MKKSDTGAGIFLILLSIAGVLYTRAHNFRGTVGLSPGFFPTFLFTCVAISGLVLIVKSLKNPNAKGYPIFKWGRLGAVVGMLLVYIMVMDYIGFVAATMIFMIACMWFYGENRPKVLIPASVLTTAIVFVLWTQVFNIALPTIFL